MLLKELYRNILLSEETAVTFLRENKLLDAAEEADPCHRCGGVMGEKRKRGSNGQFRPILRCLRIGCQTSRSVRKGNSFFGCTNTKSQCNLTLCEILELVYLFVMEMPTRVAVTLTGRTFVTVIRWYNMCLEVCGAIVSNCKHVELSGATLRTGTESAEADAISASKDAGDACTEIEETPKTHSGGKKKKKGIYADMFQSHPDRIAWMALRKGAADMFIAFLMDIQSVCRK